MLGAVAVLLLAASGASGPDGGLPAQSTVKSPAGLALILSGCMSGGFDYFFFEDRSVLSRCWGCETRPHVQKGTWSVEADKAKVVIDTEWFGKGTGRVVQSASVDIYGSYVATVSASSSSVEFELSRFADGDNGCERVEKNQRPPDPHELLRKFPGAHPETALRRLRPADVKNLSPAELRLMRNEIYARYGLAFRSPDLQEHFKKVQGYSADLANVDAFLTDVEKANAAFITAAEPRPK